MGAARDQLVEEQKVEEETLEDLPRRKLQLEKKPDTTRKVAAAPKVGAKIHCHRETICPNCEGTEKFNGTTCRPCGGTGWKKYWEIEPATVKGVYKNLWTPSC